MNFKGTSKTERKEEIDTKVEFNNHIEVVKKSVWMTRHKKYRILN